MSGCGKPPPTWSAPTDGIHRFPTGEVLEVGDIVLARSYGLIGAMFATRSYEGGLYSHGAMVYRAADGDLMMLNYRPTGMETCSPEEFFSRYNRLALVRRRAGLADAAAPAYAGGTATGPEALSAAARWWLAKDKEQRVGPDYRLDHDDHSAMFCLELTSTVYRDCGLTDPFRNARKTADDPLLQVANELFKTNVSEIHSPSGVLHDPEYEQTAVWLRPDYDLRNEALNEELINIIADDLAAGLRARRPNLLGRMKLRQIFALYHLVTTVMFWKPKQDLPDFLDAEVIDNAYMLYSYLTKTKKVAKERAWSQTWPAFDGDANLEETLDKVRSITREAADLFRDKYVYQKETP